MQKRFLRKHKPKGITIPLPPCWVTEHMYDFVPTADDHTIANQPIASKTRFKMSVEDAVEQGIITPKGADPRFTVVLPVWMPTGGYITVTHAVPHGNRYMIFTEIPGRKLCPEDLASTMNPKARLHIIVN